MTRRALNWPPGTAAASAPSITMGCVWLSRPAGGGRASPGARPSQQTRRGHSRPIPGTENARATLARNGPGGRPRNRPGARPRNRPARRKPRSKTAPADKRKQKTTPADKEAEDHARRQKEAEDHARPLGEEQARRIAEDAARRLRKEQRRRDTHQLLRSLRQRAARLLSRRWVVVLAVSVGIGGALLLFIYVLRPPPIMGELPADLRASCSANGTSATCLCPTAPLSSTACSTRPQKPVRTS